MLDTKDANNIGELIPTRRSLLSRLRDWNDHESWRVFFDTYWRLIYVTARKAGLSDAEAQDIVQETVIEVMKKMPEFRYDAKKGSFKGWLLQITKWRVIDYLRRRKTRHKHTFEGLDGTSGLMTLEEIADPASQVLESIWEDEWEQNLLKAALERVKRKVDGKHFQIFDLSVRKNWPVSKVTQTFGINRGKVYLIKHRVGLLLKKEIAQLRARPV